MDGSEAVVDQAKLDDSLRLADARVLLLKVGPAQVCAEVAGAERRGPVARATRARRGAAGAQCGSVLCVAIASDDLYTS
jgi:hypothetical protein